MQPLHRDNTEPGQQAPPQAPKNDQRTPDSVVKVEEHIAAVGYGLTDKATPQDELQGSANSGVNKAPVSNFDDINVASNPEASPSGTSKAVRIANRVTQLKQLLQEQQDEYSPHIRSEGDLEEFEEAMALLNADDERSHLSAGYPSTDDEFEEHCHRLFNAMKNFVDIDEVAASPAGNILPSASVKDSLAVKSVKAKKAIEVNIVAGKLMRAMRRAQLGRLSLVGKKIREYNNFTLRFQAVVDALTPSKLLVRSAFDGDDWIARIALNPRAELKRKRDNKGINDDKNSKQKFATMMKKRDPTLNFKDAAKTPGASKSPTSAAAPGSSTASAQQSDESPAIPSAQPRMASEPSPDSRPSKRVKTSHEQEEQATDAHGASLALDPNPMNVPGPIREYGSELSGPGDADETGQMRRHQTEDKDEDENEDWFRFGD